MKLRYKVAAVLSIATLLAGTAVANSVLTKPEYMTASTDAATIKPIAYVGDTLSGFTLRGIPDGMGAMRNADGEGFVTGIAFPESQARTVLPLLFALMQV